MNFPPNIFFSNNFEPFDESFINKNKFPTKFIRYEFSLNILNNFSENIC